MYSHAQKWLQNLEDVELELIELDEEDPISYPSQPVCVVYILYSTVIM